MNFVTSAQYGINMTGTAVITIADGSVNTLKINHFSITALHGINSGVAQVINGTGELNININNNIEGATYKAYYVKGIVSSGKLEIYNCKLNIDVVSQNYKAAAIYSTNAIAITGVQLEMKSKSSNLTYGIYAWSQSNGSVTITNTIINGVIESSYNTEAIKGLLAVELDNVQGSITCAGEGGYHNGLCFGKGGTILNSNLTINNDGGYGYLVTSYENVLTIDGSYMHIVLDVEEQASDAIEAYAGLDIVNDSNIELETIVENLSTYNCGYCDSEHYYNNFFIYSENNCNINTGSRVKFNSDTSNIIGMYVYGDISIDAATVNFEKLEYKVYYTSELISD